MPSSMELFLCKNLLIHPFQGDKLKDYPDSPGTAPLLSGEAASRLLDADDTTMEDTAAGPSHTGTSQDSGRLPKRRLAEGSLAAENQSSNTGPALPPIYYSVLRKRLNKLAVRHLDGSACYVTEGTTLGAPVSALNQIGSFANSGDKRHNLTAHRYDHTALRNISLSFDLCTLTCQACQGAHQVLRRTIEGNDVGQDNPPVFVLADQNFPPMVPVGGEGECLKIVQVENGSLTELVEVFLGLTRGFDVPAGAVVLLSSPSHAAAIGTADYTAEFVRSAGRLGGAFMGGVTVLHGIPFLLGGTNNTAAIRALAEIEHWVSITSSGTDEISATRAAFMDTLRQSNTGSTVQHIIRLPISQTSMDKATFITTGFDNLKSAVEPSSEDEEKNILILLIEELNNLYPVSLCMDIVCDRFMEGDVFDDSTMDRMDLVLIGGSHLGNVAKNINPDVWKISDLTRPGFRINASTITDMCERVTDLSSTVNMDNATVVLQIFDNSVYMAGSPGGEKRLPSKDRAGTYHIEGSLAVADKTVIKDLVAQASPLLKALGSSRKIVLTPLARYWVAPCCPEPNHTVNYHTAGFLPRLGDAIAGLRDAIRDSFFVKKVQNFRVLCPNRMIGVRQRRQEPSDDEAAKAAALWGPDPVHPTSAAYRVMANSIVADLNESGARYTNPVKTQQAFKKPRYDASMDREGWVRGCPAALSRRDSTVRKTARGNAAVRGGWSPSSRGQRALHWGGSLGGPPRGSARGPGYRKFSGGRRGYSF